jgi:hypothetical protein
MNALTCWEDSSRLGVELTFITWIFERMMNTSEKNKFIDYSELELGHEYVTLCDHSHEADIEIEMYLVDGKIETISLLNEKFSEKLYPMWHAGGLLDDSIVVNAISRLHELIKDLKCGIY